MAYTALASDRGNSVIARVLHGATALRTMLKQRREFRRTLTELQALTARELADIGLHRSEITRVAHQHVYGG